MSVRTIAWADLGDGAWRATWSGTGPFRVILAGKELATMTETERIFQDAVAYAAGPPPIEVLDTDAGDVSEGETNPPYAVVKWRGRTTADYYKVYRVESAVDVLKATVVEDGRGYYRWMDAANNSPATWVYKVTSVDSEENESDALSISVLVAGIPGRATQSYSYSAGTGNVTATVGI